MAGDVKGKPGAAQGYPDVTPLDAGAMHEHDLRKALKFADSYSRMGASRQPIPGRSRSSPTHPG